METGWRECVLLDKRNLEMVNINKHAFDSGDSFLIRLW